MRLPDRDPASTSLVLYVEAIAIGVLSIAALISILL
jgi:hypothetical protein